MFAEHAKTVSSRPTGPDYRLWSSPGRSLAIHLGFKVIQSINSLISEASGEVGGLLLGRAEGREVWIEDFEAVPCVSADSSWRLSVPEQVALRRKIARYAMPDRDARVVGFYRSHARHALALTDDDCSLCAGCFSDPQNVFLLIGPSAKGPNRGAFFFWEGNGITRGSSYLEFPFERDREERKPFALPPVSKISPDGPRRKRMVPALVIGAIGLAGIGFVSHFSPVAPKVNPPTVLGPASPALGLSALETSDLVSIHWNRRSRTIAEAQRGTISIRSGKFEKSVELGAKELQDSSLVYGRLPEEGDIKLEVFNGKTSVSEVVHLASKTTPTIAVTREKHRRNRRSRHRRKR